MMTSVQVEIVLHNGAEDQVHLREPSQQERSSRKLLCGDIAGGPSGDL